MESWRSCIRDGSLDYRDRSAGAGLNPLHLPSKDVVVSDEERANSIRQINDEKVRANESSMTRRDHVQMLSKRETDCTETIR
jgi:hypothetical protein